MRSAAAAPALGEEGLSSLDYRINAEVRRHLVSRWVDVSRLQIGTTNGVVYLLGTLEPTVEDALQRAGQLPEREAVKRLVRLVALLDKELRRLRGVRDVVLNLRNVRKKGGTWKLVGARGEERAGCNRRTVPATAPTPRQPTRFTLDGSDDDDDKNDSTRGTE